MSRRFKASKYKNAAPKTMKHEPWIRDLVVGSYNCSGSFIKASAAFVAFNVQATGSQLGVVALDAEGTTIGSNLSVLNAHSDLVTDFDFSPFEDGLLATGSADSTVKIWSITNSNMSDLSTLSPEVVTSSKHRRVENVAFNPTAEYLLGYSSHNALTLWDILYNKELYNDNELHGDTIMSMSWSKAGNVLATCAKDRNVRVVDPRAKSVVASATSHDNAKDSRVLWLGDSPFIVTTGFDSSRLRQIFVRDTRNFGNTVRSLSFDSSTGILLPMHDPDTNMMFFAGRGDSSISSMEFIDSEPYLMEGYRYNGDQTKGACLVPKRALKVMETEVNRLMQLTANSVICIPYHVPRKSYIDFHTDLFPDTKGTFTTGSASVWMDGFTGIVGKVSLNPNAIKNGNADQNGTLKVFKPSLAIRRAEEEARIARVIDPEPDSFKKDVPEPRPRKKSLSSGSSSSEEVNDVIVGRLYPIPKPRVNNAAAAVSMLRTPSSFLAKRSTDYGRSVSVDEGELLDSLNGPSSLPLFNVKQNANISNENTLNNNNHEPTSLPENGYKNGGETTNVENGNAKAEESPESQLMSTSDRRKLFESRSQSVQEGGTPETNGSNAPARKPRLTVADRLKMFQQNTVQEEGALTATSPTAIEVSCEYIKKPEDSSQSLVSQEESNPLEKISTSAGKEKEVVEHSNPAPIAKPERKFTPPKQDPPKTTELPVKVSSNKRIDTVFGQVSKYRNFKAAPTHKRLHIENLRNISTTCPGESELIQGNPDRVAVPLNTPGGKVAIFELKKPGRQPDGVIPALVHGTKVMDFMWDPFDNQRLIVGCDDGKICMWKIPEGGLKEQTNEPEFSIAAHAEKIYFVKFHPLAKDVLATGSYDLTIRIWDLANQEEMILLQLNNEQVQIFSFAWSPCGSKFATACKDGKIRIYDSRAAKDAIVEGKGPSGVRGGRVSWVLDGKYLVVAGFDRSSERQLHMYNSADLTSVTTVSLDVSPAILVPFYDEDSSILFLSGRGDSTIFAFDVIEENPYLRQLSNHRCVGAHQGISFLKKNACDVQQVEFARALRLTEYAVEPWSFTVPRVKNEFFQDDLFPPTKILWEATMSSTDWFEGLNMEAKRISLKPNTMKSLTDVNTGTHAKDNDNKEKVCPFGKTGMIGMGVGIGMGLIDNNGVKKQQEKIEQAIKNKLPLNMRLEQDLMEGVDESEWNEDD